MKKALALILTLIMVLGLMPAAMAAMAPASQQQIGHYAPANDTDGTLGEPTEGIPSEKTLEDGKVIISKNIAATQTENVFDITLTVKTTEEIKEVTSETADAAVVLVIDISNSMSDMANAQKAAQAFINSFAPAEGDTSTRKIAIVAFGTYAYQISGWVDASTLKTVSGEVHSTISGVKPNINEDTGGTNMHAGLLKASELLKDSAISSISNKNVLLFTDGVPTYHIKNNDELGGSGNIELLSQQIEHDNHAKVETTVRDNFSGIGKYAVYLGNERIYCESYRCPLYGSDGWFSYGGEAVKNWLKSLKSSDGTSFAAYSTSNASELANIFKSISELIKLKAQAWQLTDPMGDNIEFVQFLDANIDNKQATQSGGTISWDLKRDITKVHDDANKAYTYTLSYRIKLNTLSSGFAKDTFYKTNGVTDLTYFIEEQGTAGGLKHAYFNVPSVKGFAGNLTFTKVGDNNEPLEGAEFTLTTTDKDGWKMTATSGTNGQVKFENIPSGHTYTLTETKTPEGYQGLDDTYTVEVAYGVAVLMKGEKTVEVIVNTPNETPTGSLTIEKVFSGITPTENTFPNGITFTIQKVNDDGAADTTAAPTTVTLPIDGESNNPWSATVDLAPGTYTVTESDSDADVDGYDLTVSNSTIPEQTPTADGKTGTVTVTGDGASTIIFTNTYTPETIDITVTKEWVDNENEHPSVTVKLLADGQAVEGKTLTLGATAPTGGAQWTGTFMDLPKYNAEGKEIKYTVQEDPVPEGYNSEVTGTVADGFTITNTYKEPGKISINVQKEWAMKGLDNIAKPDEVTIKLFKGNEDTGKTLTLNQSNQWKGTFANLDVVENVTYSIEEEVVEGYTSEISSNTTGDGFTVKNTLITYPVQIKKEASGLSDGTTYPNVTVDIKQGDKVIKTITGLVPNGNAQTVELPAGEYTVEEQEDTAKVEGYNLNVTNAKLKVTAPVVAARSTAPDAVEPLTATVINKYTKMEDNTGSLIVKKTVSGNGADFNKAFTFKVTLTIKGDIYNDNNDNDDVIFTNGEATFQLKNGESKTFIGLPEGIHYTVTESDNDGYTVTVNNTNATTASGDIVAKETAIAAFNNYKRGGGHYDPTPDPVPPIVIPPKTGDMTIWQSILNFLGIR